MPLARKVLKQCEIKKRDIFTSPLSFQSLPAKFAKSTSFNKVWNEVLAKMHYPDHSLLAYVWQYDTRGSLFLVYSLENGCHKARAKHYHPKNPAIRFVGSLIKLTWANVCDVDESNMVKRLSEKYLLNQV